MIYKINVSIFKHATKEWLEIYLLYCWYGTNNFHHHISL